MPRSDQYPEQSYYPSAKVRLGIRFDELSRRVFDGKIPARPLNKLRGIKDPRAPLKLVPDPEAPPGSRRTLLQYDGTKKLAGLGPQKQVRSDDGLTHVLAGIMPKDAAWNQNGVRQADTLAVTLKFIDCPIDPRCVRSCWIEFYLGTVTPDEYKRGIDGAMRPVAGTQGGRSEPMNLVPDAWLDAKGRVRSNRRFQGFVDKWSNDWGEGEPLIRLDCRDNTQLFLDTEAPAKLCIDKGVPIDKAIAVYLSHFPQFAGITVEYRPGIIAEKDIPQLAKTLSKTAFQPHLGPAPSLMLGQPSGMSVWDFLTDIAGSIGHVIRVEDTNIIIERVRTKSGYEDKFVNRPDDPFQGRDGHVYRRFIYGRNLLEMKNERSFVKTVPTNIEVRCYDPVKKSVLVARYPSNKIGKGVHTSIPGDGGVEEKWLVWRVTGVTDKDALRIIAQNIYEQLGRQELSTKIKTKNLASFGGGNADPDILDMRVPDTIEILVNRGSEGTAVDDVDASTLIEIEKQLAVLQSRNVEFMMSRGFPKEFSMAYAKVYTDLGLQTTYRAKAINVQWNTDSGVSFDIEGINYIEVRADPANLPDPEETKI